MGIDRGDRARVLIRLIGPIGLISLIELMGMGDGAAVEP